MRDGPVMRESEGEGRRADEPSLRVEGVTHRFGTQAALQDACLEVASGSVHCLVGPSGSGKSTLLRLIAGLEKLREGRIVLGGEEVSGPSGHVAPEHRRIGFVFQDLALFPHLDVRRNVLFGMTPGPARVGRSAADGFLAKVGLEGFGDRMPHTLSGGQQQRVALVRALAREPRLVLLDEPFSSLDERLREEVRETTLALVRDVGVAAIVVTHDPGEALAIADRITVLREGRVLQTGSPEKVYARPATVAVAETFGRVNRLDVSVRDGRARLPWGEWVEAALPDGPGVALVRPESVLLSAAPPSGDAPATVASVRRQGALVRSVVGFDSGVEWEALDVVRGPWRVGDRVRVETRPGSVVVRRPG